MPAMAYGVMSSSLSMSACRRSNSWRPAGPDYGAMIAGPSHEGTSSIAKSFQSVAALPCAAERCPMVKQANAWSPEGHRCGLDYQSYCGLDYQSYLALL